MKTAGAQPQFLPQPRAGSFKRLLGSGEVRILDQAHHVAKRIGDRCHPNVATDVLNRRLEDRPCPSEMLDRGVEVRHAPVGYHSSRAQSYPLRVWIQPELVASN